MIELKYLSKTFQMKDGAVKALQNINLTIPDGAIYGIIGMSGAGKSTLVRCINLLERPTKGEIIVDGQRLDTMTPAQLRAARRNITMIFQHFNLLMQRTCLRNVCFPMEISGVKRADAEKRGRELLELVGLPDKADAYPAQLSGGQQQRVAIARALNMHPKIMLLDEPTSALDPEMVNEVLDVIKSLAETNMTIVMVTHEMGLARDAADKVVFMENGLVVDEGTPAYLFGPDSNERVQAFLSKIL